MLELLEHYSLTEIAFFIVMLAAAIKGAVTWFDWAEEKIGKKFKEKNESNEIENQLKKDIDELKDGINEIYEKVNKLTDTINLLIASDKDDIKAYITREHHYFCYKVGHIDDYNLDCIERRFSHYKDEGGNSFIADLMSEIRALPKQSNSENYQQQINDIKDNNRDW